MRLSSMWFLCLAGLASTPVVALTSDKEQPINIEADQVDIDERNGVSTYTGKVTLSQGTLHMSADTVVVYTHERRLIKMVASGNPAKFRQRPDDATQDVQAKAKQVEYRAPEGIVLLKDDAELRQGDNSFAGARIEYDSARNAVRASGSTPGSGRVQVIIQPATLGPALTAPATP